jgi:hypothetical protein
LAIGAVAVGALRFVGAMESKERELGTLELAAGARAADNEANLAAQRAAANLRRAAAALRAQGYGSPPRRGA